MKRGIVQGLVVAGLLVAGIPAVMAAEEGAKTLPTLLIKGEVVSVDATDAAAPLLKVKDRYGFETPIYLAQATKITKGDQALQAGDLAQGTAVEVEYNFDINTAKRHAVSVKVVTEASAAPADSVTPVAPAQPEPAAMDDMPSETDMGAEGETQEAPVAEPAPEAPAETPAQ